MQDVILRAAPQQLESFDDSYPCDRCGRESNDLAQPHKGSLVWWCGPCRATFTACQCCDTEIRFSAVFCEECEADARLFDHPDHFGDDR